MARYPYPPVPAMQIHPSFSGNWSHHSLNKHIHLVIYKNPWTHAARIWDLEDKGIQEKLQAHYACCAVSKKVLFLSASVKLSATYLLHCKGKTSERLRNLKLCKYPFLIKLKMYLFLSLWAHDYLFLQKVIIRYYCYSL